MAVNRSLIERQLYQQGGGAIFPRIDGLSSGISSAEQQLQQINQSIDQVQSTLGDSDSGGVGQNPFKDPVTGGGQDFYGQPGINVGLGYDKPRMIGTNVNNFISPFGPRPAVDAPGGMQSIPGDPRLGAAQIPGNQLQMIMRGGGGGMSGAYRNMAAGGGIMSVVPREQYGLGSIIKKAVKGVKKIVKSPLGKAALLIGGGMFAGGLGPFAAAGRFGSVPGAGFLGNMFSGGITNAASNFFGGEKTLGKTLGVMAGGSLLGGILSQAEQTGDVEGITRNVDALRSKLTNAYKNQKTFVNEADEDAAIAAQVEIDLSEYNQDMARGQMAEGGRIGFFKAGLAAGDNISPGTSTSGGLRGDRGGPEGPPSIISEPPKTKTTKDRLIDKGIIGLNFAKKYNPFNLIFGTPVAADEFDMEAFEKAGAKKGFFGINDELEAMQKYYDFAQKQKAMGKDPAAIRNSAKIGSSLYGIDMGMVPENFMNKSEDFTTQKAPISFFNSGGRAKYALGSPEQNAIKAAGVMNLPLNQNPAGVTELDLRETGGFIPPVGVKEKADDIPAMLANNEFVFTADAVRGMGEGNVNKGAQRMYDMMKQLEKKGRA